MGTENSRDASTLIVFYSISGSAGKSYLASLLFEEWLRAFSSKEPDAISAGAPLLVDADLVGATLSRVAYAEGIGRLVTVDDKLTTLDLASARADTSADLRFIPAAPWLRLAKEARANVVFPITKIEEFRKADKVLKVQDSIPEALSHAQRVQARLARDPAAHRQLWRNLATAAVRHGPRRVIVDLPAQGPAGVSLDENWRRIRAEALHAVAALREKGIDRGLRLVRALVFMSEEPRTYQPGKQTMPSHPLIEQTIDGVTKDVPEMADVVVLENFFFPRANEPKAAIPRIVQIPVCRRVLTVSAVSNLLDSLPTGSSFPASGDVLKILEPALFDPKIPILFGGQP